MNGRIEMGDTLGTPNKLIRRGVACLLAGSLVAGCLPATALGMYREDPAPIPASTVTLQFEQASTVTLANVSDVQWFTFTPQEDGRYEFYSTGDEDTFCALYELSGGELEILGTARTSEGNEGFRLARTLEAGSVYYLACSYRKTYGLGQYEVHVSDASYNLDYYGLGVDNIIVGTTPDADTLRMRLVSDEGDGDEVDLEYGADYEISNWYLRNNEGESPVLESVPSAVGDYEVEVRGIGKYRGTALGRFSIIDPADISCYEASAEDVVLGETPGAETLRPNVYLYNSGDKSRTELVYGTDFEISGWYVYDDDAEEYRKLGSAPTEVGTYFVEYSGIGNYHGTQMVRFDISDMNTLDVFRASASDVVTGMKLDAESLHLQVYRKYVDYDYDYLTYGTDFKISGWYDYVYDEDKDDRVYRQLGSAPTAPGAYFVEVTGIGAYHDTKLVRFEILDANELGSYELHGNLDEKAGTLAVGFDYPGGEDGVLDLKLGKDFEIDGWYEGDYWDEGKKLGAAPSEEGEYTLVFTGTGSFTGKKWVEFYLDEDRDTPIELKFSEPTIFRNASSADEQAALKAGDTFTSGKARYTVISPAKKTVAFTKFTDKKAKTATVPATVNAGGVKYKVTKVAAKAFSGTAAKTVTLGKNVASVAKGALSGSAAMTVTVKSTAKPTKKTFAKGCFGGSKVKAVKVPKAQKKAYKKLLTKAYTKTGAKKLAVK